MKSRSTATFTSFTWKFFSIFNGYTKKLIGQGLTRIFHITDSVSIIQFMVGSSFGKIRRKYPSLFRLWEPLHKQNQYGWPILNPLLYDYVQRMATINWSTIRRGCDFRYDGYHTGKRIKNLWKQYFLNDESALNRKHV